VAAELPPAAEEAGRPQLASNHVPSVQDAIDRFGIKRADFKSLAPTVVLPVIGTVLGGAIGKQVGPRAANLGRVLGGTGGGLGGLAMREHALPTPVPGGPRDVPPPAPAEAPIQLYMPPDVGYTIDANTEDIPAWALEGARALKQAGVIDWILGRDKLAGGNLDFALAEVPGALPAHQAYEEYQRRGLGAAAAQGGKSFLGMAAGGIPGALLGAGVGKGIERLTGHKGGLNVPLVNLNLSDILAGLGGSIGAVKGSRAFTGQ